MVTPKIRGYKNSKAGKRKLKIGSVKNNVNGGEAGIRTPVTLLR
jgi:hypothetical protein